MGIIILDIILGGFEDDTFTSDEYVECLKRLNITHFNELVGKEVYYSKPIYGIHKVVNWDSIKGEYTLELDGYKFKSNPFRLKLV